MVISIMNSHRSWPLRRELNEEGLFELLSTFRRPPLGGKDDLPCWIPGVVEGRKTKSAVQELHCFVIDVDNGTAFAKGLEIFPGVARVVHTSWSHSTEVPKWRVVFPLAEPVPGHMWSRSWTHLMIRAKREGLQGDEKCKNQNRLYYLPARNPASTSHLAEVIRGARLEVPWRELPDYDALIHRRTQKFTIRRPGVVDLTDPQQREQVALAAGFTIDEGRAFHGQCPGCGRRSAWFYIAPRTRRGLAYCNHRETCGWSGSVAEFMPRRD